MKYIKLFFLIPLFSTFSFSGDYVSDAYHSSVGQSASQLENSRAEDENFVYLDPKCCCNDKILKIFKSEMKKENRRVNPATDILIESLVMIYERIDLKLKEVKNMRIANGIYSFSDTGDYTLPPAPDVELQDPDANGCKALDFNNQDDREWYVKNVIDRFEGSGNYGQYGYQSNAFGKYQFMPDTGAQYCQRAPASLNCCSGTFELKKKPFGTTNGREWRIGANAQACQDAMFTEFTKDNISNILSHGIQSNSCNIYIAHNQGVGGLAWIKGGSWNGSFSTLQNRVKLNVGASHWQDAIARGIDINAEDGLRQIYIEYWNKKFGGDINANIGRVMGLGDFLEEADKFNSLKSKREDLYRKGIILEMYRQKEQIEKILEDIYFEKNRRSKEEL